jgi:thiol:disulfide interchange protein DsbD
MHVNVLAQMVNPVHFKSQLKELKDGEAEILFSATIDAGWHVYSTNLGEDGPISASFNVVKMDGAEPVGKLQARGKEIKQFDKLFDMELRFFENAVTFAQKIRFTKPQYDIDCYVEYGACNDQSCLPPSEAEFKGKGNSPVATKPKEEAKPEEMAVAKEDRVEVDSVKQADGNSQERPDSANAMVTVSDSDSSDLWAPVVDELKAMGGSDNIADHTLLYILLMGFIGGLLAVCMPCIWPIIPMTVSFFLKRSKNDKEKGIRDAVTYGVSIIVIYLGLGLLVTAIFGSDTLNAMSTNAVFNIFLFLLLVVFALSFFGWFEIRLPDSWANKVDTKASETSGLLSIFLMAFTLVLVSFSCTAPIIGLLLVETTTSGNWLAPALGMFGFALALALPFTLFALFPAWLKQAPKSGSWMNTLKIVRGFIELAFALKFFSVADLAYGWHLLDREVFLSLWIAIFFLMGLYLTGLLKFQSDGDDRKPMPVLCIMLGLVSFAFSIYMVPGLWGAPCRAVSAFAPPLYTQDFNLNTKEVRAAYTNYEEGMAAAAAQGKPVMLDFTGFGCVNCRKMEIAVWTDPTVASKLTKDYVLISLFVDDKTPLKEPMEVEYNGKKRTLRTVGDKWSYLEEMKFGYLTQPLYVLVDNDGRPLTRSFSYKEDVKEYLDFLDEGLKKYP